jgi:hypothetical protein
VNARNGLAIVDIARAVTEVNNIDTSTAFEGFRAAIAATAFQFTEFSILELHLDGDCAAFARYFGLTRCSFSRAEHLRRQEFERTCLAQRDREKAERRTPSPCVERTP